VAESPSRDTPPVSQVEIGEPTPHEMQPLALQAMIEPALLKQVLASNPGDQFRFVVELEQQISSSYSPDSLSRLARQQQVVAQLKTTASHSQADLLSFLQSERAKGKVQQIHPFWIFNGLAVIADADTVLNIATRPDVRIIREDHWRRWVEPVSTADAESESSESIAEWNIAQVRADLAWSALGLDGSGVTVAIMDTGVDWQHPALLDRYRGYKPGGLPVMVMAPM
jgi:bacillopeptidase F